MNKTSWDQYNKNELELFDSKILQVYDAQDLIRIGPKTDGGYIIVENINYDYFVSCGISTDIRFEESFLDKYPNLNCIAFDGTIKQLPDHKHNINWINKNIGFTSDQNTTNLKEYIDQYEDIFLKMDIEGHEFNWIESITLNELKKFSQIVMEIHWPFDQYRSKMLEKLNQTHYAVHIHGNNYGNIVDTINVPEVLEVTYVRKNLISHAKIVRKKYPTEIDYPNNPNKKDLEFTI